MRTVRPKIKTRYIRFRAGPDEESRWREFAKSQGQNFSEWVRNLADNAVATNDNSRELVAELTKLRTELARGVGNNLNQLAHVYNANGSANSEQLDSALADVALARVQIERALREVRPPRPKATPHDH